MKVHIARSSCWLQGQLRPAYSLAPAPGMTKELLHAKNARDASKAMQVRRCCGKPPAWPCLLALLALLTLAHQVWLGM